VPAQERHDTPAPILAAMRLMRHGTLGQHQVGLQESGEAAVPVGVRKQGSDAECVMLFALVRLPIV
jgi:hypothetical protein